MNDNSVYLTFDLDWAHDEVILDTATILEEAGVSATFFVTHDTPVLERLRGNPNFELGIHPNFNPVLAGDGPTPEQVVDTLMEIVPEATSVRSHSLVNSSRFFSLFRDRGLRQELNLLVPERTGIPLKAFSFLGMVRVPHCWEDNLNFVEVTAGEATWDPDRVLSRHGLKVLDFHPIHVFLNTEHVDRYENSRSVHREPDQLIGHRLSEAEWGARRYLRELIQRGLNQGFRFGRISEVTQ